MRDHSLHARTAATSQNGTGIAQAGCLVLKVLLTSTPGMGSLPSAAGFLGYDVNIYCRGITKESVDGGEEWKPPPASAYGPPKDHLRDVIFTNEFANTLDQLAA